MGNRSDRRKQKSHGRGMLPSIHALPDGAPADDAIDGRVVEPDRSARPVINSNPVEAIDPVRRATAPRKFDRPKPPKQAPRQKPRPHQLR